MLLTSAFSFPLLLCGSENVPPMVSRLFCSTLVPWGISSSYCDSRYFNQKNLFISGMFRFLRDFPGMCQVLGLSVADFFAF